MVHFGTIFTKAITWRRDVRTATVHSHVSQTLLQNPARNFSSRRTTPDQIGTNRESAKIDRSISLTGEIDIPEYYAYLSIVLEEFQIGRVPHMHFSPQIESIRSKTSNIESRYIYISIIETVLSLLFDLSRGIDRSRSTSNLEPGSLNVHAEICNVRGWLVRSVRAQHTCCSAAWFFCFLGSLSVKRPPCEPPHTGVRERSWARQRQQRQSGIERKRETDR